MRSMIALLAVFTFVSVGRAETCTDCHDDKLDKPVVHPAAQMDCTMCHVTHDDTTNNIPNRLIQADINGICFNCHDKKELLEGCFPSNGDPYCGHPVAHHPVDGRKDPLYPERDFTCVSCHNPHSAKMDKLFRYDYTNNVTVYQGSPCAVCHWDKYGISPDPVTPPWNGTVAKKGTAPNKGTAPKKGTPPKKGTAPNKDKKDPKGKKK